MFCIHEISVKTNCSMEFSIFYLTEKIMAISFLIVKLISRIFCSHKLSMSITYFSTFLIGSYYFNFFFKQRSIFIVPLKWFGRCYSFSVRSCKYVTIYAVHRVPKLNSPFWKLRFCQIFENYHKWFVFEIRHPVTIVEAATVLHLLWNLNSSWTDTNRVLIFCWFCLHQLFVYNCEEWRCYFFLLYSYCHIFVKVFWRWELS